VEEPVRHIDRMLQLYMEQYSKNEKFFSPLGYNILESIPKYN